MPPPLFRDAGDYKPGTKLAIRAIFSDFDGRPRSATTTTVVGEQEL